MPNLTNITISDREATPADHIFAPHGEENGIAVFVEEGSSLVGNNTLTISSRDTGTNVKIRIKLDMPVVQTETINGVANDKVTRRAVADGTFTFAKSSTLQERKNLIELFMGSMSASQTAVDKVLTAVEKWY